MGGLYTLFVDNGTQSTSNDALTIIPASARSFELVEISIGGMATASAANSTMVARSTGGTTPGGSVTARPHRVNQAAAGFTNATTWAAQPTSPQELVIIPWNANGGLYRWVRIPGDNIIFADADTNKNLTVRGKTGTSAFSFHVMVEEF